MSKPVFRNYREVVVQPDGRFGFLVGAEIIDPGSGTQGLPFPEVFVLSISDPLNPKSDILARISTPLEIRRADSGTVYIKLDSTSLKKFGVDLFARVANIAEYTQLSRDRGSALVRGQTEYLSSSISFLYEDSVTATAAYKTIIDRVSQLVTDWIKYRDGFIPTVPPFEDYTLPNVSIGVEAELRAAYTTARDARIAAETNRDAAQKAKDDCTTSCACKKEKLAILFSDVSFLQATNDYVTTLVENATATVSPPTVGVTAIVTQSSVVKTFILGGDSRSLASLLSRKKTELAAQQVLTNACDVECARLSDVLAAAITSLTNAQAIEATALAAILVVCPTFDPTSV